MPPVASKTSRVDLPLSLGDELDFAHPTKPSPKLLLNQAAQHFPHYCPSPTHDRPSGLVPLPRQQPRTPVFDQSERSKRQFERSTTAAMLGRAATPLSTSQPNSSSQPQSTRVPGPSFPSTFASNPAFRSVSAAPTSSPRSLTPTFSAPSTMQPHLQHQHVRNPYLLHAEERLEWVREIAGVPVLGSQLVPILWRGCTTGCLDFLTDDDEEEEEEKGGEKDDDEFDFGSDSDVPEGFGATASAGATLPAGRLGMLRAANSAGALPRGMQVADSQRTIRPGMIDEEDEDEDRDRDGFDVDGWRMGS
ncbi:hypothetical protein DL93DRAFT_2086226 [Clavulina sp. PMI_390]|nr:hypothetical protein DL93DRAFT_2086226 [Clavulina sp. PMI_390]